MDKPVATFGDWVFDRDSASLTRSGVPVSIGYRAALLLAALIGRSGEIVTKAELMDAAWPGLAVEESNLTVQIFALRKLLGASGEGPIATVPRIGYRFVGPLALNARREAGAIETPSASIAVLPFVSLSDDVEQAYFADGLSEDLIVRLSRLTSIYVAPRNACFAYRGRSIDARTAGRELAVSYVLGGSVRRSGDRLRITADLSDVRSGRQVWTERYDLVVDEFFAVQDQISQNVIAAVEPQLFAAENHHAAARPTESLDAWGHVMRAMPYIWSWGAAGDIAAAQASLHQAIAADPSYGRAEALLAWTQAAQFLIGWADAEAMMGAGRLADEAIYHAPDDPWTHFVAGYVHMGSRRFAPAVVELERATDLNPSFVFAHLVLGNAYAYAGLPDEGLHHLAHAARLAPRDYTEPAQLATIGFCMLLRGQYAEAVEFERRATVFRPHFSTAWRTMAAAAGLAGDLVSARKALSVARRLQPSLSAAWIRSSHPLVRDEDRVLYLRGLHAAGLPE